MKTTMLNENLGCTCLFKNLCPLNIMLKKLIMKNAIFFLFWAVSFLDVTHTPYMAHIAKDQELIFNPI